MLNEILKKAKELVDLIEKEEADKKENSKVALSDLNPGDRFDTKLGKFIVLDHDKEHGWTKVLQDDFFEEDVEFDNNCCDYTKSKLKKKFDSEITDKYAEVFGDFLVEHEVLLNSVDMQDYGSFTCKVRPMTFDEVRQYNQYVVKKDIGDWWWTCTPWSTEESGWKYGVIVVSPSGNVGINGCDYYYGVRPFCILKSNLFVSCEEE